MPCQIFAVYPASNDLVDMCPNIWCNNSKETFFLAICFFDFDFYFVFNEDACFLCALCGKVTPFCALLLKTTVQNPLWKRQVCPKFIKIMMENNRSHKSGTNIMLYNTAMKGFPFLSQISIWSYPLCFDVKKFPSGNLVYLSVSTNEPSIKSKISGVMWQVAHESKIQLLSCDLSLYFILGFST